MTTPPPSQETFDRLLLSLNVDRERAGEEYELLFTAPLDSQAKTKELSNGLSLPITLIGEITAGEGLRLERDGAFEDLPAAGYEHLG